MRYLFYEAVTAGIVPKKTGRKGGRRPDADLIQYATELREKGIIPWGAIVDESRTMMAQSSWETPTNFLDEAIAQYRSQLRLTPDHVFARRALDRLSAGRTP